ncbi:MAG: hypothetical protein KF764_31355 [Labilithrix sp.]|nr:hypothetical protein [Labilithrix sp.]
MLAAVLLFGALASKEVAIAFSAAFVAAALRPSGGETRESRRARLLRLATTVTLPNVAYFSLRALALRDRATVARSTAAADRVTTALEAVGRYAEMLVDPLRPRTCIGLLGEVDGTRAVIGAVLVLAVGVTIARSWRRLPAGAVAAVTIPVVGLSLVLHLVPIPLAGSVTADRLLYVPLAGATIAAAVGLSRARLEKGRARVLAALALVVTLAFAGATRRRLADYADEALFWTGAAEAAPRNNPMPLLALASVVREAGETELACRIYDHARSLPQAAWTSSAHRRARENLVSCWAKSGRYEQARALAEELARDYPRMGRVKMTLAFAQVHVGDFDGATRSFAEALELEPALSPFVVPAREDLAIARAEAPSFHAREIAGDERARYARHLARIGHLPEAEQAQLTIAEDPTSSHDDRRQALAFLVAHGRIELARRALAANRSLSESEFTDAEHTLRIRAERRAPVLAVLERIDALVKKDERVSAAWHRASPADAQVGRALVSLVRGTGG